MRFLLRTIAGFIIWFFLVVNVFAQETDIKSSYFKVLKSENIDFSDTYKNKKFELNESFKVGRDEYKKVSFGKKYGIYNMTQNQWVVNIQYERVKIINDSIFHLKLYNSKTKLYHIDPQSKYNLENEFDIDVSNNFILFHGDASSQLFDSSPSIFFPRISKYKVLPYDFAHIINDTLIKVRDQGKCNVINSNGKLIFNEWVDDFSFDDNKFFGSHLGYFHHKLQAELDYNSGQLKDVLNFKFKTINFVRDPIKGKYNIFEKAYGQTSLYVDTFYQINDNIIILSSNNQYYPLLTLSFKDFPDFVNGYRAVLCDSIKLVTGGLKLITNKKTGLLSSWFEINLRNPVHQQILTIRNDNVFVYVIKNDQKITLYKENGNIVKECLCDNAFTISSKKDRYYDDSIICFQKNGDILLYDIFGNLHDKSYAWIINDLRKEINLDSIQSNEIIKIGDKFGIISKNNKIIVPFEYDYIQKTIHDGVYLVSERTFKDNYAYLIDIKKNTKVTYKGFIFSESSSSKKYFKTIGNDGKLRYFAVNFSPFSLVSLDYFEELSEFKSVLVSIDGKYGFESFDGTKIIDFEYEYGYKVYPKLLALKNDNRKYALFNVDGKRLTSFKFDTILSQSLSEIVAFSNDTISILKYNSERNSIDVYKTLLGYKLSKKGTAGLIELKKNGRVGAIDFFGNVVIEPENDWIHRESSVYNYLVQRNGRFYFKPINENEIFKNGVDTAYYYKYIINPENRGILIYKLGTKYGLHRLNLKFTDPLFDDIYEIHGDLFLIENDRKLGLYDIKKKAYILEPEYNGIFYKDKDNITVIKGNLLQTISIPDL